MVKLLTTVHLIILSYIPAVCTFEQSNLCGYTQDTTDTPGFDWSWKSGTTGSTSTGPASDHTTKTNTGHYVYIETSSPRRPNDTARLISPMYQLQVLIHLSL